MGLKFSRTGPHQILKEFRFFPFDNFFQPQRYHLNLDPLKFDYQVSTNILGVPAALYLVSEEKGGHCIYNRVRPRFFDQVGHQTTNASIGNKYFFNK